MIAASDAGPRATARQVLVAGSVNVDFNLTVDGEPDDDGTGRVLSFTTTSGGHAGNCAEALARLGCAAEVFAAVGGDSEGAWLLAELEDAGVGTSHVQRLANAPTGRVVIPAFGGRRYMLMFRGATDGLSEESCDRLSLSRFGAVVVLDPGAGPSLRLLHLAQEHGVPSYWNPGGLGARETWVAEQARVAGTLILNRTEFAAVTGAAADPEQVLTACRDLGPARLVVTCGGEGAFASDGLRCWFAPAVPAPVRDSTGAGEPRRVGGRRPDRRPQPRPACRGPSEGGRLRAGRQPRHPGADAMIEVPEGLSRLPVKRTLFGTDPYFRDCLDDLAGLY